MEEFTKIKSELSLDEYLDMIDGKQIDFRNVNLNEKKDLVEEISRFERFINYVIRSVELSSKNINIVVSQNDREFVELVRDFIGTDLYKMYKGTYVYPDFITATAVTYHKTHSENPEGFLYTDILDEEHIHLNTCLKLMDKSQKDFSEFINVFDYNQFRDYYNYVFTNINLIDESGSHVEGLFSENDLRSVLFRLSLDELLVLEAFADSKLETPTFKDLDPEEQAKHRGANMFIHETREAKEKQSKNIFSRIRGKINSGSNRKEK